MSMFSGFILPNQYEGRKNNYGHKEEKRPRETESENRLHRVRLSEQEGLKHRLIDVDVVPVLRECAWKQRCFKVCFSDKKLC